MEVCKHGFTNMVSNVMTKWYFLSYKHQCFNVQIKFYMAHEIFQWPPLIFNDFSRQNAIFPGQHKIPWLFKSRVEFYDFSRPVGTMDSATIGFDNGLSVVTYLAPSHYLSHYLTASCMYRNIWKSQTPLGHLFKCTCQGVAYNDGLVQKRHNCGVLMHDATYISKLYICYLYTKWLVPCSVPSHYMN